MKGEKGFARFPSQQAGWNALRSQIILDANRGKTLQQFIYKYAPPQENNAPRYLSSVAATMKASPASSLKRLLGL